MKDQIIEKARRGSKKEDRLNLLREELHHLILQETDRKGGFGQVCFVGGTALRIVFGLDRFSEDLDFSLASTQEKANYDLLPLLNSIQKSLEVYGLDCQLKKFKKVGAVQSGFFTFKGGLLHGIDRSFNPGQKLYIKFDVDANPPAGGEEEVSPVSASKLYKVRHYSLSSLFAGKLNAVLFRVYTKGRDLYDFLWYVGKGVKANKVLLENAMEQSLKKKISLTNDMLQNLLMEKFGKTDFTVAQKDVAPFLTDSHALTLFDKKVFLDTVSKVSLRE